MTALAVEPNPGVHDLWVGLGVGIAVLVFWHEKRRRDVDDPRLWAIVGLALGWGAIFARLGTWAGDLAHGSGSDLIHEFVYGNRSILGGLVGAYGGALLAKRATGYRARTGALFAPAVAIGMAVGRVGCLLTELPGTPTSLPWGVTLTPSAAAALRGPAGVPLHPSFGYEIAFHLVAFALVVRYRDRLAEPADIFVLWLAAYAVFRFVVEFVRGNDVAWVGLTRPQLFLAATVPLLLWRAVVAVRRQPDIQSSAGPIRQPAPTRRPS